VPRKFFWAIAAVVFLFSCRVWADGASDGVLPTDASGRALNLDFEDGTLRDWTATGDAFKGQPIKGDAVFARRKDMHSNHAGDYWIGTFEVGGDSPRGTLTSVSFKVTQPWATMLIGGGSDVNAERVELVDAANGKAFFFTAGRDTENMRLVVVDLRQQMGKQIFIRLVDDSSSGWGHINFDDFKFHSQQPAVAVESGAELLKSDVVKYAGLTPRQAVEAMTLPPGFKAQLVAGEPDIVQPIAFAIDDRGRLWVAEALDYPQKAPPGKGQDKILIFEDTKGDGHFDKRTVFMDGLNLVSGLEVGFGGVWVGQAPQLLYIPILPGDKPGKPEMLLDGWAYQDTHETLNSFAWGPDGWLYGCQGVFNPSKVGKPGTPDNQRVPLSACVWRYHPTKKTFEVYAEGGSNQWGIDWNAQGQMFMTCCVIPHLYHVVQGGRYIRQAGPHTDPYTFDDIKTIADHLHWASSAANQWAAVGKSDAFGGGHAHAGAMIYLGDNWPAEYRNQIFMGNIHGNRMNEDLLEQSGSSYIGHHGKDFLLMNDKWSRLIAEKYGPDGGVYVIDWYDKQACHLPNEEAWDRTNGRIYKITYGDPKPVKVDLASEDDSSLARYIDSPNEWYFRHARRILQERYERLAAQDPAAASARAEALTKEIDLAHNGKEDNRITLAQFVREYYTLYAISPALFGKDAEFTSLVLRGQPWLVQLLSDAGAVSKTTLKEFEKVAHDEGSLVDRLAIASAMQRLPVEDRWEAITALLNHGEDNADHMLPLMDWYATEALVPANPAKAAKLAIDSKIPLVTQFIARRLATMSDNAAAVMAAVVILKGASTDEARRSVLEGMVIGFAGKRHVAMPDNWSAVYDELSKSKDGTVRQQALAIATVFGDPRALAALRQTAQDDSADISQRQSALDSLLAAKDADTLPILQKLITTAKLSGIAIRGLAMYDDPQTPSLLIAAYPNLDAQNKLAALNTLASRRSWAEALLKAVDASQISKNDLTAPTVRDLDGLGDSTISQWIAKNWGSVRASDADKKRDITHFKSLLKPELLAKADAENGRAIFARTCMVCHTLYGVGAKIGPDLTGSNRANVDYLVENIVDPSAVIGKDYLLTLIRTKDGQQIEGIVKGETDDSVTLAQVNGLITVPKNEIAKRRTSNVSMMPEGLLAGLKPKEVRDLIKYLSGPQQTAMLVNPQNANQFFNGKDLTGWTSDHMELWHVENGQIVGKTEKGIAHNNFLFSDLALENFRLVFQIKLVPNEANSGVQFRSIPWENGEAKGYQADIGHGWWGKIYEESDRGLLTKDGGEQYLKPNDWNTYEILAVGDHIRLAINGHVCSEISDLAGKKRGQTGLQIHAGGPTEVRFKDWQLELNPKDEMATVK
jgi:putative membrane-bound dehydrogenase-like protein